MIEDELTVLKEQVDKVLDTVKEMNKGCGFCNSQRNYKEINLERPEDDVFICYRNSDEPSDKVLHYLYMRGFCLQITHCPECGRCLSL